eukprot:TRINITY_DN114740_c0_g1_i1.p1 TRINITY_DN114740_c0_g1~~TRINITY_DN114740_c0_g1_i1.p1  ORF type:complete len:351 (-),score=38.28 TRINITY_DN114740_c0_g1_i1:38-1090(-)
MSALNAAYYSGQSVATRCFVAALRQPSGLPRLRQHVPRWSFSGLRAAATDSVSSSSSLSSEAPGRERATATTTASASASPSTSARGSGGELDWPLGRSAADEVEDVARQSSRVTKEEISYTIVILKCCQKQEIWKAAEWLEEMLASPFQPNLFVFNAVITAFGRRGKIEDAEKWLARMIATGIRPNCVSYNPIMTAFAKAGRSKDVEQCFKAMLEQSVHPDTRSFNAALLCCVKTGSPQSAKEWLQRMHSFEPKIPPDDFTYTLAIRSCENVEGDIGGNLAREFFAEMLERDVIPNAYTLDALTDAVGPKAKAALCLQHNVSMQAVKARTQQLERSRERLKPKDRQAETE